MALFFFNELIQVYPIYSKHILSFLIKKWVFELYFKNRIFETFTPKFYGVSVEIMVEYFYVIVSFNNIFIFNSAYIFLVLQTGPGTRFLYQVPRYKSATLKMSEFGHMCRSWQCPPNSFFFTRTQIKSLYRFFYETLC